MDAVRDARDPWRTPVLATFSAAAGPQARTAVLRSADLAQRRLTAWTEARDDDGTLDEPGPAYFAVLSEPTRLKIMHAVCNGEKTVSQIVAETGATQTNISRHLGLMHRHGVLARRR